MKKILSILTIMCFFILQFTSASSAKEGVSVYAGTGKASNINGTLKDATFNQPYGIAMDKDGSIIVVDTYNNLIRKIKGGIVSTIAGHSDTTDYMGFPLGGFADGDALSAMFNKPKGITIDSSGDIFITDSGNNAIRKISKGKVTTFAGNGTAGYKDSSPDGKSNDTMFRNPTGIVIDSQGYLFVSDTLNHVIRKISPNGIVSTFAGVQSQKGAFIDGSIATAAFNEPSSIALFEKSLIIADSGNQAIRKIEDDIVCTIAGSNKATKDASGYVKAGFTNGKAGDARFNFPKGLCVLPNGSTLISDTWNHSIRVLHPNGTVETLMGNGLPGNADGDINTALLNAPTGILFNNNTIYFSDMWNNQIKSFQLDISSFPKAPEKQIKYNSINFDALSSTVQIWYNGKRINFPDTEPYISDGKTMVPLRFICESWGASVNWLQETSEIEVIKGSYKKLYNLKDGNVILKDDRSTVHIAALARELNLNVSWVPEYYAVVISE